MKDARVSDNKKKIGRPATGVGTMIGVRVQPADLAALDEWIACQPDPKPTRPDAIRQHLRRSLDHCSSMLSENSRSTVPNEVTR
ncbi:hypothetical protein FYJ91_12930 [Sphingomonas montanisoli]|uniref:CopG family transcriptional regulator n=1 Tax=Sphingomonas montanisoli TaxID=2606412 RepID=A0A5D9C1X8_9SPHN|nr:hypothetical protein FYJ91_12930 [Sphingomonas montanisoli]